MPLPGSEKYRKVEDASGIESLSEFDRANAAVSTLGLLLSLGCNIPTEVERSWKFHCPFEAEHMDQGIDKTARYYGSTDTAYCFAGHDALNPVRIIARLEGLSYQEAATKILEDRGLLNKKKQTYQERMEEALSISKSLLVSDPSDAIAALRLSVTRDLPEYTSRQFDADIRERWIKCASVLQDAIESHGGLTPEQVSLWLQTSKEYIRKGLGGEQ